MKDLRKMPGRLFALLGCLVMLLTVLAACGGSGSEATAVGDSPAQSSSAENAAPAYTDDSNKSVQNAENDKSSAPQQSQNPVVSEQYLIKSLQLTLRVDDTRKTAVTIQNWVAQTDKNATTSATNYRQIGGSDSYYVTLTFSVPAASYDSVYAYLRDYTVDNKGELANFSEQTEDVSTTYVDVEARLSNLRAEQDRLQRLLGETQTLGEILEVEARLSQVEGEIESYQAQKNLLDNQISYYTVTVSLEPLSAPTMVETPKDSWSIGQVFQDAFSAVLSLGREIVTLLVWLLAFSLYLVPVLAVVWFVFRWRRRRSPYTARPKAASGTTSVNRDE